jgi:hypothetical protein
MSKDGENTPKKHRTLKPAWEAGKSGNPAGRPKGSRNKLGEEFIAALHADFVEHGATAIKNVREQDPSTYMRVTASILPKELEIKRPENELSDEQLARVIERIERELTAAQGGSGAPSIAKPPGDVSAVH